MAPTSSQPSRVFAIVPAAGRSRRMGSPKQLLDVGGRTMLDALLQPLLAADVAGVMLVTHQGIAEQLTLPDDPRIHLAANEDEHSEMIDSIRIGLRAWRQCERIDDRDGFLVCPADHPGIATEDFNSCAAGFRSAPDRIIIATRAGKRGHPIVFPAGLAAFVESSACDAGLNALPRQHANRIVHVECASAGVSRDIDTPQDYEALD